MTAWLERPLPVGLCRGFRWFLAVKILVFAAAHGSGWWACGVLLGCTLLAARHARIGWLGIVGVLVVQVFERFPWTPNHHWVELVLAGLLAAYPQTRDPRPVRAAGLLIVLCFVGSAYQKLFHGRWLDGEYLTHAVLFGPDWSCLPWLLRRVLSLPEGTPAVFGGVAVAPGWLAPVCLGLSWLAVTAELLVPLAVLVPRTRRLALPFALGLQVVVSGAAGIWGFGLTGLACWWTWSEDRSGRGHGFLLLAAVGFAAFGALCDRFGWLPWVWQ